MIPLFSWCPFQLLGTNPRTAPALFHGHKLSLLHRCSPLPSSFCCQYCSGSVLCIPGRDARWNDFSRKSGNSSAKEELLLLCSHPSALVGDEPGQGAEILPEGGSCMNRSAHCPGPPASRWEAEGAVKRLCHGNVIFILLEMPSGCPPENVLGQVWKCCLVCQVYSCLWQLYSPQHDKRFLKTSVLTGILIYTCSIHLQQIQDLLQVPRYSLPTSNSDFVEDHHW